GLGSQRAMHRTPELAHTFAVREHAPTALVLANLGIVQAAALPAGEVERLARAVGADAVCIHLNPAQEMIQANGDRDFRQGLATLARLVRELPLPIVVKETGCGLSRGARAAGVALPIFRAYREGGVEAAGAYVDRLVAGLKLAMVLTGSRELEALGRAPVVLGGRLRDWLAAEGGA